MELNGEPHIGVSSPPGKNPRVDIQKRAVWADSRPGSFAEKKNVLPGIKPRFLGRLARSLATIPINQLHLLT